MVGVFVTCRLNPPSRIMGEIKQGAVLSDPSCGGMAYFFSLGYLEICTRIFRNLFVQASVELNFLSCSGFRNFY